MFSRDLLYTGHAFLPLVFAEATAAAVLALALLSLVVAEAAAAAVLEHVPAPVVLADTAAVFTLTRLQLVLAEVALSW